MGDLFDKAIVSYQMIQWAADMYIQAARKNPQTQYVVLKGNHDWMRDLEKPSAFDLWAKIVAHVNNIHVVTTQYQIDDKGFFAWHPTISAARMMSECYNISEAYGHWDIESYGGDDTNLIPTKIMNERGISKAFTGHIHKPQTFTRDGVDVVVVGSMQPYAHGEEVDEKLYVTRTKAQFVAEPDCYHNKCLRLVLGSDEVLDLDVDCLQLTVKKDRKDNEPISVSVGEFDIMDLFQQTFNDQGVPRPIQDILMDRYTASRMTDG